MKTKIILIRHAETSWNRKKIYCGHSDISLDKNGINQAGKLRRRLRGWRIQVVYSSDMRRALQTARLLFGERKIKKSKALREINFGLFEGLNYKQIMKKYPLIYKKWLNDPYKYPVPNGENLKIFKKRVKNEFRSIAASSTDKTVAVVTHGGVISIFLNTVLKASDFWSYIPKTATFSVIEFNDKVPHLRLFSK